jgi:hypothetical protein
MVLPVVLPAGEAVLLPDGLLLLLAAGVLALLLDFEEAALAAFAAVGFLGFLSLVLPLLLSSFSSASRSSCVDFQYAVVSANSSRSNRNSSMGWLVLGRRGLCVDRRQAGCVCSAQASGSSGTRLARACLPRHS